MVDILAQPPRIVHLRAGRIFAEERTILRRTKPRIPVKPLADGIARIAARTHVIRYASALRPHGAIGPHMHFLHLAKNSALEHLRATAHRIERRTLVAHLHDHAVFLGRLVEVVELPQRAHQRLLHIDMDTLLHCLDGDGRMDVVGRRNRHRINAEHTGVGEQITIVRVVRNLREIAKTILRGLRNACFIDRTICIAKSNHLGHASLEHWRPIAVTLAADTDRREADLAVGTADREATAERAHGTDAGETAEEPSSAGTEHYVSPYFCPCMLNMKSHLIFASAGMTLLRTRTSRSLLTDSTSFLSPGFAR